MAAHVVAGEGDIKEGERVTTQIEGKEIAVFNVEGTYYAYINWCVHQGGPICEGNISNTTKARYDREKLETEITIEREGRVVYCPWHGWQYDLTTGECLSRKGINLPSFPVNVTDGQIIVSV